MKTLKLMFESKWRVVVIVFSLIGYLAMKGFMDGWESILTWKFVFDVCGMFLLAYLYSNMQRIEYSYKVIKKAKVYSDVNFFLFSALIMGSFAVIGLQQLLLPELVVSLIKFNIWSIVSIVLWTILLISKFCRLVKKEEYAKKVFFSYMKHIRLQMVLFIIMFLAIYYLGAILF